MGQVLLGGRGGARLKYNLFVQPDEPTIKDGLWIKAPEKKRIRSIVAKDNFFIANTLIADELCEFSHATTQQRFITGNYSRCYKSKWIYYAKYKYVAQYDTRIAAHRYNVMTDTDEEIFATGSLSTQGGIVNTAFIEDKMYFISYSGHTNVFTPLYDMENEQVLYDKKNTGGFSFDISGLLYPSYNDVLICLGKQADEIYMYAGNSSSVSYIYVYNMVTKTVRAIWEDGGGIIGEDVRFGDSSSITDTFEGRGSSTTNMFVFNDNFLYILNYSQVSRHNN